MSNLKVSALARREAQMTKLKELGVEPVAFEGFDDTATLQRLAANFDCERDGWLENKQ
jgi:hypothetical protein